MVDIEMATLNSFRTNT